MRNGVELSTPSQDKEYLTHSGTRSTATVEEWHMHRYGCICILALDTKGSLLSKGGKATSLLSALQWSTLSQILHDPFNKVIVIASDIPFVLDEAVPGSTADGMPVSWSAYQDELHNLLEKLFKWKHAQYPAREVVLLSSGPGFGTTGDICDHELGLSIPIAIVGPVLGRVCNPKRWKLQSTLAGGRFSYVYRNPVDKWNFCMVDIDLSASQHKPNVEVQMIETEVPPGTTWAGGVSV
eukprot:CAMPEP_0177537514 /NCGR_PEP_ID=MMETSP0369-20130122/57817_1 /TAXON_ID=447022 ORGANISM="Scrippsiella hangoei-like, Strain SHHI-4" /NCGR_SAMPLE_ID=MMETSP0369 /ASSEMBLY_ACC=CAM_ASM_000364 /LENGTH=237 /DNA_ID=CAMNT_0019020129 /DNA_START=1 /DNA_END=710 /DNA_ORIENTATION=+